MKRKLLISIGLISLVGTAHSTVIVNQLVQKSIENLGDKLASEDKVHLPRCKGKSGEMPLRNDFSNLKNATCKKKLSNLSQGRSREDDNDDAHCDCDPNKLFSTGSFGECGDKRSFTRRYDAAAYRARGSIIIMRECSDCDESH